MRIPASGVLGLGAERSAVLFHSVRLRMLTGTAQVLPLEITRSPVEHPR